MILTLLFDQMREETAYERLERGLPPGYKAEVIGHNSEQPEAFLIFLGSSEVAIAKVDGKSFVFEFSEEEHSAAFFGKSLVFTYPEIDPNRLLWLIIYPHLGAYTYVCEPKPSSSLAIEAALPGFYKGEGTYLVAFKASEWPSMLLKVDKSYLVTKSGVTGQDEGEKAFLLTNDESG